jgi:hypothetical protein
VDGHHSLRRLTDPLLLAELGGPDDERLSVGLDLERRVLGDAEQLENRALDDEPEAVADCGELLDHGGLVIRSYEQKNNVSPRSTPTSSR